MRTKLLFTIITLCTCISCKDASETDNLVPTPPVSLPVEEPVLGNEIIFTCDFQSTPNDMFITYDLDQNIPTNDMKGLGFSVGKAWLFTLRDSYTSTNIFAGSTSSYNPEGQANDWMITKEGITISDDQYILEWKSQALLPEKTEHLEIYISTKGNNPETDFDGEPVFTIEEEAGESENTDNEWFTHTVSLKEYAGQTIWIAFVNRSYNKSVLCIDDILIRKEYSFILENLTDEYSLTDEADVKVKVTAKEQSIDNVKLYYKISEENCFGEEFANLSIAPGNSKELKMYYPMSIDKQGEYQEYKIWAEIDGKTILLNDSIIYLPFKPSHKVVIEEGTGQWCGYCPLGILALEYIEDTIPGKVIPIAVHNSDVMTVQEYDKALGFSSFPIGLINRKTVASPTDNNYNMDGEGSFFQAINKELQTLPEAEVLITNIESEGNILSVESNIRFMLHPETTEYALAYVIVANNYMASGGQINYLSETDLYPSFGKFGKGGEYGQRVISGMPYNDIACGIFPSFEGKDIESLDTELGKDNFVHFDIDLTQCQNTDGSPELEVVAMLINKTTGQIVNADKVPVQ